MSRAAKPVQQMAFITIGHGSFLMEASKAMKVAELMQHAVEARWDYYRSDGQDTYTVGDSASVEFKLVRANQVRVPQGEAAPVAAARPRLLK